MEAGDYTSAWVVYSLAGLVLSWLAWTQLRKLRPRELGWLLQCWFLALIYTPWEVEVGGGVKAPALLIVAMDMITVSAESAIRAVIPLVLALMLGLVVTALLSIGYRVLRRRRERSPGEDLASHSES